MPARAHVTGATSHIAEVGLVVLERPRHEKLARAIKHLEPPLAVRRHGACGAPATPQARRRRDAGLRPTRGACRRVSRARWRAVSAARRRAGTRSRARWTSLQRSRVGDGAAVATLSCVLQPASLTQMRASRSVALARQPRRAWAQATRPTRPRRARDDERAASSRHRPQWRRPALMVSTRSCSSVESVREISRTIDGVRPPCRRYVAVRERGRVRADLAALAGDARACACRRRRALRRRSTRHPVAGPRDALDDRDTDLFGQRLGRRSTGI